MRDKSVTSKLVNNAAVAVALVREARVGSIDDGDLSARVGLGQGIDLGDAVAVTANRYWTASRAFDELDIE